MYGFPSRRLRAAGSALLLGLFLPGLAVIVAVLALNFLGDGLRDASDPYGN